MIPQIIYFVLLFFNLILAGYNHGKPKDGVHNLFSDLLVMFLSAWLLAAGGFFNPLFN